MNDERAAVDFAEVYKEELEQIVTRRRQAKVPLDSGGGEQARAQVSRDLVGVALSGGGVRSASFSLGLIQSLYKKGVLRFVDYLSTVSGGGYAGSCFSSLALHPETKFQWNSEKADENNAARGAASAETRDDRQQRGDEATEENFPLAPLPDGRQPPRVVELIHGGASLRRPLLFFNRYLIGVVLTNIVLVSALFTVAAAAAYLFRCLDFRESIDFLYALGFRGDVWRAFFPSYVLCVSWLLMWAISYWRKGSQATGRFARWFMTLTFVSVLLALAALLGTGDISLNYWRTELGRSPPSAAIHAVGEEVKVVLVGLLLISLLPYLRLKDLIRSGTRPKNVVEGWIFAVASRALLFGLPLLVFAYFAHENISRHNELRLQTKHGVTISQRYDMVQLEVRDWRQTWRGIELQASAASREQAPNLFKVSEKLWQALAEDKMLGTLRETQKITQQIGRFDRESSQWDRWLQMFTWSMTRQENDFSRQFARRKQLVDLKREICDSLTTNVIRDPQLFASFADVGGDFPEMTEDDRERLVGEINALVLRGQGIQRINDQLRLEHSQTIEQWLETRDRTCQQLTELKDKGEKKEYQLQKDGLEKLLNKADGQYATLADEVQEVNWALLKTYYGEQLAGKDTVYAMVVVGHDQATRLRWVAWSAGCFLLFSLVVSLNATSLHGFYRNRLSQTWITPCPAFGRNIPLAKLETTTKGAPYHLIGASLHFLGRNVDHEPALAPFLFSQSYCGSERTGYVATDQYAGEHNDLPNAMSLSGAAVTPTQVHNPLLAALLLVANSRLGQWLPNPLHRPTMPDWVEKILSWLPPSPLRLLVGWLQKAEGRHFCFVADGGHTENLGLLELLRRRCKLIIVSDASHDPNYQFQNYVDLHRRVRSELGIRLKGVGTESVEFHQALPDSRTGLAARHYVLARILYPPLEGDVEQLGASEGLLILLKPNFTGDEPIDLQSYRSHEPPFPHHPTADQFYDPGRFESYRQLGFHIGEQLCDELLEETEQRGNVLASGWLGGGPRADRAQFDRPLPARVSDDNFALVIASLQCEDVERRRQAAHLLAESTPLDEHRRRLAIEAVHTALSTCRAEEAFHDKAFWALEELSRSDQEQREHLLAVVGNNEVDQEIRLAALDALEPRDSNAPSDELRKTLKGLAKSGNKDIARRANEILERIKSTN